MRFWEWLRHEAATDQCQRRKFRGGQVRGIGHAVHDCPICLGAISAGISSKSHEAGKWRRITVLGAHWALHPENGKYPPAPASSAENDQTDRPDDLCIAAFRQATRFQPNVSFAPKADITPASVTMCARRSEILPRASARATLKQSPAAYPSAGGLKHSGTNCRTLSALPLALGVLSVATIQSGLSGRLDFVVTVRKFEGADDIAALAAYACSLLISYPGWPPCRQRSPRYAGQCAPCLNSCVRPASSALAHRQQGCGHGSCWSLG
jgi:hypothetical protein